MRKFFAGLIASLFLFATGEAYAPEGQLYVTMLDVGQGESILIETPSQNILIDAGDVSEKQKLQSELEKAGVTRFERIILTHQHADHIGGMGMILDNYEVDEISDNGFSSASPLYQRYRSADVKFSTLREGDLISFGNGVVFEVLNPAVKSVRVNNDSVVGKLKFGDFKMLITGDIEREVEEELIASADISADVLDACHHGSITSCTEDFLGMVNAKVILISAGKNNAYGHPHKKALRNMRLFGSDIYCTAFNGTIKVVSDGSSQFTVICDNQADWLEQYTGERVTYTRL